MVVTLWVALMALLMACGDEGGNGGEDTLLTGMSGVVIVAIIVWLIVRSRRTQG